jgi:hypothetical protein
MENNLAIDVITMQELLYQLGNLKRCNDNLIKEINCKDKMLDEKDRTIEVLTELLKSKNKE